MTNPWKTLGIALDADDTSIKKSYKKMSLRFHPDRIGGDGDEFKAIKNAYNLIKDSKSRARYLIDNKKHSFKEYGCVFTDHTNQYGINGRGSDVGVAANVSINNSINGGEITYSTYIEVKCGVCLGWGFMKSREKNKCSRCNGMGLIIDDGGKNIICKVCNGVGATGGTGCKKCNGRGSNSKKKSGVVQLLSGTNDGDLILIAEGQGNHGRGVNGDLFVFAALNSNKYISLSGMDIIIEDPITISMAVLGGAKKVFVVGKKHEIKIRPGTQCGDKYIIKGMGIARGRQRGDIVLIVKVEIPSRVSNELKELLKSEHDELSKIGQVGAWHKHIGDMFGE